MVPVQIKIRDKFFYGWVVVGAMTINSAVLIGSRHSYGVFFKSIESDFGLNRAVTSGVFSAFMAFSAVFSLLGGWSLDKFGPKWTMAVMGLFTGLSLLLTSQTHSAWQLYLTYSFLLAAGTGITYLVVVATVSRWFEKKRGLALGVATTGGGLGTLILAPFATYLIVNFDWRTAYIVMGMIALVLVMSFSMLLKGSPSEIGLLVDGVKPELTKTAAEVKKDTKPAGFTTKEALKTRQFWLLFMAFLLGGTGSYIINTHIVPHATDVGISAVAAATIMSVSSAFSSLGSLASGAISDKIGRKTVSIICPLIGTVAMFWLMWMPPNLWLFYAFAALFGINFGGISIMQAAVASDMFGVLSIGKIMGWLNLGWFAGAATGPLIGGTIYDIYQSYFFAFLIAAICLLLVVLIMAMLTKPKVPAKS